MGVFNVIVQNQQIHKSAELFDNSGEKLNLPNSEDVIFMNTPFWGGGCRDIWGSKSIKPLEEIMEESFKCTNKHKEIRDRDETGSPNKGGLFNGLNLDNLWLRQKYGDKALECVSLKNVIHMAQVQTKLGSPDKIAQSR